MPRVYRYNIQGGCNIRCKGFSNLFIKADNLLQMKLIEHRTFLAFAKTLQHLVSLVYEVFCRNGNVTLEIRHTIHVKYAFFRKRDKFPCPWNLLIFQHHSKLIRTLCFKYAFNLLTYTFV